MLTFIATANLDSIGVRTLGDTISFAYKWTMILDCYVYRIRVFKTFKGNLSSDTVTIVTSSGGCGLMYQLEPNKRYVFYATKEDITLRTKEMLKLADIRRVSCNTNTYWTSHCMRVVDYVVEEQKELERLLK